jgi:hypothetical protein
VARVVKPIRSPAGELGVAEVGNAAEHGCDPAARPAHRVLDLWERTRLLRRRGERIQELSHQVAAAVVKAGDLVGIVHRILGYVFGRYL